MLDKALDNIAKNKWQSCSDTYESIVWKVGVTDIPTKKEVESELEVIAQEVDNEKQKVLKEDELNTLEVDINTVFYDANMEAIGNMGVVTAIGCFQMIKALYDTSKVKEEAARTEFDNVIISSYETIFKQTLQWKGADNKLHEVQGESVAEAAQKAMTEKSKILFKY